MMKLEPKPATEWNWICPWWIMHNWLENFPYRTEIEWWIFVLAGLLTILVTGITVSIQTVKSALENPVKSLRNE